MSLIEDNIASMKIQIWIVFISRVTLTLNELKSKFKKHLKQKGLSSNIYKNQCFWVGHSSNNIGQMIASVSKTFLRVFWINILTNIICFYGFTKNWNNFHTKNEPTKWLRVTSAHLARLWFGWVLLIWHMQVL